jgi:hypothetical protein
VISDVGTLCALITAAVLLWAAAVKLRTPKSTAAAIAGFGIPGVHDGAALARLLPAVEAAVAVLLVTVPRVGGVAAVGLLLAFTAVLTRALVTRPGETIRCGCFGASSAPISPATVVRNVMLTSCAAIPMFVSEAVRSVPSFAAVVTVTAAAVVGTVIVQLTALKSDIGSLWSTRRPASHEVGSIARSGAALS